MTRMPLVRVAVEDDRSFLAEHDRHLRGDVLDASIRAGRILIVEDAGTRSGWLRWNLFWDEIPFLNLLFVLGPGRGHGLGTALMDEWEASLLDEGHPVAMTSTQADETAQHFYRKRGYVDTGTLLLPEQAAEVFFRKELSNRQSPGSDR